MPSRVKGGAVHFINTKSKRRRSIPIPIPIPLELEARILEHFKRHGLFTNCRNAFEAVMKAGLELPAGQKAHVLRHTFASHFMANGGNILSLQKILGHSTLAMTMRYAHLAPGHLQDVLAFGPSRDFRHFFDTPPESATELTQKPYRSTRKAITPGGVAGLQTRWGTAAVPGWVRLPLPSATYPPFFTVLTGCNARMSDQKSSSGNICEPLYWKVRKCGAS